MFANVPTGTEITYNISQLGYNTASGTWIIDTDVEYETEYVVLSPLSGNYRLLVGNLSDPSIGALFRGYYTRNETYGDISPDNYAGYPIKSCYAKLRGYGPLTINIFILELEGDSRNDITSLVLKINGIDYTLGIDDYSSGLTKYYINLSNNGALFYYLDANINKSVDIEITAP